MVLITGKPVGPGPSVRVRLPSDRQRSGQPSQPTRLQGPVLAGNAARVATAAESFVESLQTPHAVDEQLAGFSGPQAVAAPVQPSRPPASYSRQPGSKPLDTQQQRPPRQQQQQRRQPQQQQQQQRRQPQQQQQQRRQRHAGLQDALSALADPSRPVVLPPADLLRSCPADNRELDKLVASLGRSKATWRRALMLFEWLKEAGHPLDDRLCTTLMRVCADNGQAATALGIYDWMRAPSSAGGGSMAPTVFTFTAAMRAALSGGLLDRAASVWDDAKAADCPPDCRLATAFIEVCAKRGATDKALDVYTAMRAAPRGSRLAPAVHAYTAAMRAATEGGRWARALEIWDEMRGAGVAATAHAYAAGISACACGGDWRRAVGLFEEMCDGGVAPDVVSCTALVTALGAGGQWKRSEDVVRWMLQNGLRPNVRTYTALLTALGSARQWDRAERALGRMSESEWGGVEPNAYTFSALIKCMGEHGEWARAEALFASLEARVRGGAAAAAGAAAAGGEPVGAAAAAQGAAAGWGEMTAGLAAAAAAAAAAAFTSLGAGGGGGNGRLRASIDEEMVPGTWAWQAGAVGSGPASGGGGAFGGPGGGSAAGGAQQRMGGEWTSAAQLNGLDLQIGGESVGRNSSSGSGSSGSSRSSGSGSSGTAGGALSTPSSSIDSSDGAASVASSGSNRSAATFVSSGGVSLMRRPLRQQQQQQQQDQEQQQQQQDQEQQQQQQQQRAPAAPEAGLMPLAPLDFPFAAQPVPLAGATALPPPSPLVNEVVCGALMMAFDRAGRWRDAAAVLPRAAALGVRPNAVMYNTAIGAAGRARQPEAAEALFRRAVAAGAADGATYESLVAAYGMAGDPARAEAAFASMAAAGLRPREYAYCGLVAAHSLAGDAEEAIRVRSRMRRAGARAGVHAYNALVAACDRGGMYERALDLLRAMRREGVQGNALTAELAAGIGRKGAATVESQQLTAAALSAAMAAAGTLLIRSGVF